MPTPDYIAVCPDCGAHVAAVSGHGERTRREAVKWILAGLSVVRKSKLDVVLRTHSPNCPMGEGVLPCPPPS